jgi:hypothetical protein
LEASKRRFNDTLKAFQKPSRTFGRSLKRLLKGLSKNSEGFLKAF